MPIAPALPSCCFASPDMLAETRRRFPTVPVAELTVDAPADLLERRPVPVRTKLAEHAATPPATTPTTFRDDEVHKRVVASILAEKPTVAPGAKKPSAFAQEFRLPIGQAKPPKPKRPSAFALEFRLPVR